MCAANNTLRTETPAPPGSLLEVTRKFVRIFKITAKALRSANKYESKHGPLTKEELQKRLLAWSREVLSGMHLDIEIRGEAHPEDGVLMVGNHISYLDIPLLMASVPVVFVAKEEVSKWLIIGPASKKAGTVFVKRESSTSRAETAKAIRNSLLDDRQSVAIFPSGTTAIDESKPWRKGAFAIAAEHGIPVQPFRITYEPLRSAAYIERDFFPVHLWKLLSSKRTIKAVLEFAPVRYIKDPVKELRSIQLWSQPAQTGNAEFKRSHIDEEEYDPT